MTVLKEIQTTIDEAMTLNISEERKAALVPFINYIKRKVNGPTPIQLNFICTHNSRRSQLSQIWAQVAAHYYGVEIQSFSGGVEVTEFNPRAVATLQRVGFEFDKVGNENPHYFVKFLEQAPSLECFSKTFDDPFNAKGDFAAIMTCSHADENCPFIPGAEARIPVRYEDPKEFDNTDLEIAKYDERSLQIASEMFYSFKEVSTR